MKYQKPSRNDLVNELLRICRELSELTNSEAAVKEARKQHLQLPHQQSVDIIEFLPDATFVIDVEGRVIAWNRAMEEMTGVPKRDILGKGDYLYAVPFYGDPKPILIDFVIRGEADSQKGYHFVEKNGFDYLCRNLCPQALRGQRCIPLGEGFTALR